MLVNGYALLEPNGCLEYFLRIQTQAANNMAGLFMEKTFRFWKKKVAGVSPPTRPYVVA